MKKQYSQRDAAAKARTVAGWLDDKKAEDILALDVSKVCSTTEAMVIATARSERQAKALAEHLRRESKSAAFEFLGMEGQKVGQWVLVDMNDVVVHIFKRDVREYFDLESMWSKGEEICRLGEPEAAEDDEEDW